MVSKERLQDLVIKKLYKADDFIKFLCYANAGMLNIGNIMCFDHAISHLPSQAPIVEIGSFCGLSANVITYLKLKHEVINKLICTDPWNFHGNDEDSVLGANTYIKKREYSEFIKSNFIKNISFFSSHDLPFGIQLKSDDFFELWKKEQLANDLFNRKVKLGGKISFAYIDGDHSYEFASRDFQNVDKFLDIGGFILFDDSADGSDWEVCQVVAEVANSGRYQMIRKSPNYFFQKLKNIEDV